MWRPSRWPNGYRDAAVFVGMCTLLGALGAWIGGLTARRADA
jgi:hypothetical protein